MNAPTAVPEFNNILESGSNFHADIHRDEFSVKFYERDDDISVVSFAVSGIPLCYQLHERTQTKELTELDEETSSVLQLQHNRLNPLLDKILDHQRELSTGMTDAERGLKYSWKITKKIILQRSNSRCKKATGSSVQSHMSIKSSYIKVLERWQREIQLTNESFLRSTIPPELISAIDETSLTLKRICESTQHEIDSYTRINS